LPPPSFASGSLRSDSYARPGKLFTASRDLMVAEVATLNPEARQHLIESVVAILRGSHGR
jgi:mRNA interferase MazF